MQECSKQTARTAVSSLCRLCTWLLQQQLSGWCDPMRAVYKRQLVPWRSISVSISQQLWHMADHSQHRRPVPSILHHKAWSSLHGWRGFSNCMPCGDLQRWREPVQLHSMPCRHVDRFSCSHHSISMCGCVWLGFLGECLALMVLSAQEG
jgi:hypothetical protein